MKTIIDIARMELQKIFYSPIAWLILIVFAVQSGILFISIIDRFATSKALGYTYFPQLTFNSFARGFGFFNQLTDYLYLYIPLLTMGLMSKEFVSGSIKLLYSSPISNVQIILGKYLSTIVFAITMVSILFLETLLGLSAIKDFDYPQILTGLLGVFLLICTYSAIGLFMSSLTSYQVVAAISTFVTFFALDRIGILWQDIEFVRDITYWLSLGNRVEAFFYGLICSEDLLYFVFVSGLFVTFSVLRLRGIRNKGSRIIAFVRYLGVFLLIALLGYVSKIPSLMIYHDSTRTKLNTLTKNSQDIISQLEGKVKITTYVNLFGFNSYGGMPRNINIDLERFEQYRRFKPDIEMKYKYYYAPPVEEPLLVVFKRRIKDQTIEESLEKDCKIQGLNKDMFRLPSEFSNEINLKAELNRFVRKIETEDGKSVILRVYNDMRMYPSEAEKTAAFKHLVQDLPVVGFVTGHKERGMDDFGSRGYYSLAKQKPYRYSLLNNGFDFSECKLSKPVDKSIDILVIADAKTSFSKDEMKNLNDFIDRGGNLIIAADRKRQDAMNPLVERFGVTFEKGQVVEYNKGYTQDLVTGEFTLAGKNLAYQFAEILQNEGCITMDGVVGIGYNNTDDFKAIPVLVSDTMKSMPILDNLEFLKQIKKAQKDKKDEAERDSQEYPTMPNTQHQDKEENGKKKEYIGSWNELKTTDFIDEIATYNPKQGELGGPVTTALALTRKVGGKEQRIMILGDADCFSNGELSRSRTGIQSQNFYMATGMFFWLSNNEVPIDVRRPEPPDNDMNISDKIMPFWNILYKIVFPALLALAFLLIWLRRKGR